MKEIDIIQGIQHVGDDLITRAEDYSPYPKPNFKGVIAAAACLLLVVTAVPIALIKLNQLGVFSSHIERLDADEYGRTFYNIYSNYSKQEYNEADFVEGNILLSSSLEYLLTHHLHEEQDCFAVTVTDALGADLNKVHEKFTYKYDVNDIAKNDPICPTIYVTESQLRSMEPVEGMCLCVDSVAYGTFQAIYTRDEYSGLTNEKFTKFYGQIRLNYNSDDAARKLGLNPEETSAQDTAVLAELERYYRDFAADYGIDPDKLFAGGVRRTLYWNDLIATNDPNHNPKHQYTEITLYGEFETATAEMMIHDKRVQYIMKVPEGSYIYEERGMWSYPTPVPEEKLIEIPANTPYGELVEILGHTAQYGESSLHVYRVGDYPETVQLSSGPLIILNFDDPNELCPYSGEELLENAVSLQNLDTIRYASSDSRWRANAVVIKENLALVFYRDRIKAVRLDLEDIKPENIIGHEPHYNENGEVNWYDQRRADEREIYRFGIQLAVRESGSLENLENSLDEICVPDLKCEWVAIIPQKLLIDIYAG